jgi:hypothetical protein
MPAARPIKERISEKAQIAPSGCHEWTGYVMPNGYGQVHLGGKTAYAHRVAYELRHGPIANGLYVLHRCDNRRCVNVDHLFLGTHLDNVVDCVQKSRHAYGDKNGRRKLNAAQAVDIRNSEGTHDEIAARYGVSRATVTLIKQRRTWQHL